MICRDDITNLKTDIDGKIGQKIIVIEKAYPNIFIVKYEENDRNVTYSYTDILTRTVEVQVFDGQEYSPLIPPAEDKRLSKKIDL